MAPYQETQHGTLWFAHRKPRKVDGRPPLILIHGAGGSHLHWPPQIRQQPEVEVLALDLPGHGRSPGKGSEQISGYAAAVLALLDAREIGRAILCGHSMGGAIAQWLALETPKRVAGLILIATGARLPVSPLLLDALATNPENALTLVGDWAYGPAAPQSLKTAAVHAMRAVDPTRMRQDLLACNAFDSRPRLGEIRAPTLVVGAEMDRMMPLKFSRYLADQIPGAELVTVPNVGHMLMLEAPDEVGRLIGRFVLAQK